ncbi:MAG: hypothetical protein OEX77_09020 [Candidatus Bathyarchaeota archaeon]|nr:hypothetical protein [Candidatus Bathyarchaeota archaeon]
MGGSKPITATSIIGPNLKGCAEAREGNTNVRIKWITGITIENIAVEINKLDRRFNSSSLVV